MYDHQELYMEVFIVQFVKDSFGTKKLKRKFNLSNHFMAGLQAVCNSNPNDEDALRAIDLLYDAALVSSGFTVSILVLASFLF